MHKRSLSPRAHQLSLLRLKLPKTTARQILGCLRGMFFCFVLFFPKGSLDVSAALRQRQSHRLGARRERQHLTRGTEPRTTLNHTLGVILSRCSMNSRLLLKPLPQARRQERRRCEAAARSSRHRGGHREARGSPAHSRQGCRFPSARCGGPDSRASPFQWAGGAAAGPGRPRGGSGSNCRAARSSQGRPPRRRADRGPDRPIPPLRVREREGRAGGRGKYLRRSQHRSAPARRRLRPHCLQGAGRAGMAAGTRRKLRSSRAGNSVGRA